MFNNRIKFVEDTHEYYLDGTRKMLPMSETLNRIEQPFDKQGAAFNVARSRLGWHTAKVEDITRLQKTIIAEWDEKTRISIVRGKYYHKIIEDYDKGIIPSDQKDLELIQNVIKLHPYQYRRFNEVYLYSEKYGIAGTSDRIIQRQKSKNSFFDITDYKSNKSGITYDSIKVDEFTGEVKHPNYTYLYPFEHLEKCLYTRDCLQLSGYAFMLEETYKVNIGSLSIIEITDSGVIRIPVPYMKREIEILFTHVSNQKEIPVTEKQESIPTEEEPW